MRKFVSRALLVVALPACGPETGSSLSDEQIVEGWLAGTSKRAPLEVTLGEGQLSGQCDLGEFPDPERTWSDGLVRREVVAVVESHASIGELASPRWVFGPNQQMGDVGVPSLFAAAPWQGVASITCGGEAVAGQIVLLSQASPMEALGVLDREELKSRMSENVEREGLAPVTDVDVSVRLCPDTAEGCTD